MQIQWSEGGVSKLAGVGTEAEEEAPEVWQREWTVESSVIEGAK
jgi:hypothetical protein